MSSDRKIGIADYSIIFNFLNGKEYWSVLFYMKRFVRTVMLIYKIKLS